MLKEKFKLSETLQFLSSKINAITGGGVEVSVTFEQDVVTPGEMLEARVSVRSPEKDRTIDYVALSMRGSVQREGKWVDYTEGAEVAQGTKLMADHEFVIPLLLFIPEDAVLTEDGASWVVESRAVLDRLLDPRAAAPFTVALESPGSDSEEE